MKSSGKSARICYGCVCISFPNIWNFVCVLVHPCHSIGSDSRFCHVRQKPYIHIPYEVHIYTSQYLVHCRVLVISLTWLTESTIIHTHAHTYSHLVFFFHIFSLLSTMYVSLRRFSRAASLLNTQNHIHCAAICLYAIVI